VVVAAAGGLAAAGATAAAEPPRDSPPALPAATAQLLAAAVSLAGLARGASPGGAAGLPGCVLALVGTCLPLCGELLAAALAGGLAKGVQASAEGVVVEAQEDVLMTSASLLVRGRAGVGLGGSVKVNGREAGVRRVMLDSWRAARPVGPACACSACTCVCVCVRVRVRVPAAPARACAWLPGSPRLCCLLPRYACRRRRARAAGR
jgi:hypothetical protein